MENVAHVEETRSYIKSCPNIFRLLTLGALQVAKDIKSDFSQLTEILAALSRAALINGVNTEYGRLCIQKIGKLSEIEWEDLKNERVYNVDGGSFDIEIFTRRPLIIRVGIYSVLIGERDIEKREDFIFTPIFVGDLIGGIRGSADYVTVIRTMAEYAAIRKILTEGYFQKPKMILLHGPLLYRFAPFEPHIFKESDIKIITEGKDEEISAFREKCKDCPARKDWCKKLETNNEIRAICYMQFLLNEAIKAAHESNVLLAGVVERPRSTVFIRELFGYLLSYDKEMAKKLIGREIQNPAEDISEVINKTGFNDPIFLSFVLRKGEYTEFVLGKEKYEHFSKAMSGFERILPLIYYSYVKSADDSIPFRVEVPDNLKNEERIEVLKRVYLFSQLLPNYCFPVGLDVVDKYARVPSWMADAVSKLVLANQSILREGLTPEELQKLIMFLLLGKRDFYYRPQI